MNNFKQPTNSTNVRTMKSTLIAASIGVLFTSATLADDSLAAFSTAAAKYSQKTSLGFMSQVMSDVANGQARDLIVVFDDTQVHAKIMHSASDGVMSKQEVLNYKQAQLQELKQSVLTTLSMQTNAVVDNYTHLPMATVQIDSTQSLDDLLDHPGVVKVYENVVNQMFLTQSLPLIHQPQAEDMGEVGQGTTIAVIDTGVDYTHPAFGSCQAAGAPGCKVVFAGDFATDDGQLDDSSHGTNVAGAVMGVAPETRIAALDVFDGQGASVSDVLQAINWSISNQQTYNIVAMNLSLGAPQHFASECSDTPYTQAFAAARAAGILPVVASGNEASKTGIAVPACAPGAVSVGAVYDENVGSMAWSNCADMSTAADQTTCFSNSGPNLTLLAPGATITAAGIQMSGTSQAAPHVAGAVAVLQAAFPSESIDRSLARMVKTGTRVTDPANGLTHPRLDLAAAIKAEKPTDGPISKPAPNPTPVTAQPLELLAPLGAVNTVTPEYSWGATPWANWYYVILVDNWNQTITEGYVYPNELGCNGASSVCRITPNLPLFSGQNYRWMVYAGNQLGYEESSVASFTIRGR